MLAITKKETSMKTSHKLILAACLAASLAAALSGCASTTLEQQIAVKEPGSWDFKWVGNGGREQYIRIYDSPTKVGWFLYEYGQKSPCNQGFQKVIKLTVPGVVQYELDPAAKSFACGSKIAYTFRTDEAGHPKEGWVQWFAEREKKKFQDIGVWVRATNPPQFTLVEKP
jgi:hypothetical protein